MLGLGLDVGKCLLDGHFPIWGQGEEFARSDKRPTWDHFLGGTLCVSFI